MSVAFLMTRPVPIADSGDCGKLMFAGAAPEKEAAVKRGRLQSFGWLARYRRLN